MLARTCLCRFCRIVLVFLSILVGTPGLQMGWATPEPGQPGTVKPARQVSGPVSLPMAQSAPRALPADLRLVGTIVVKDGPSFALVHMGDRSLVVREGGEIDEGIRVARIQTDQMVIERQGLAPEVVPFYDDKPSAADLRAAEVLRDRAERAQHVGWRMRQ